MIDPRPLKLHLGDHFYGSGNIGDDLMLAGLLLGLETARPNVRVSCASMFADAQRGRFPQVTWLPYDLGARANAIDAADAWVGGGGSPFQLVVGTWLLDHLAQEVALCKRYGKPMFLIGAGANERAALDHPHARAALEYATHVWTRDDTSAEWLSAICGASKVTSAADLSHIAMSRHAFPAVEQGVTGYVLNFEDPSQFRAEALCELVVTTPGEQRWLVQEVRELAGSERAIHAMLPEACQGKLPVRAPDYAAANWHQMVDSWGVPQRLLTSRYHGVILGAWMGADVLAVCRSDKVRGVAKQLGVPTVDTLTDAGETRRKWNRAHPLSPVRVGEGRGDGPNSTTAPLADPPLVPFSPEYREEGAVPREVLQRLASFAQGACDSLVERVSIPPVTTSITSPAPRAAFASLDEMNSPLFRSFMQMMNAFATAQGLRTFTNWTKIWEYPWLWHACLSGVPWRGARLVDLGSEISPMPWFLATLGASVHLIEVDPQWEPAWIALRDKLAVDVEWSVVKSEKIPVPDGWADVVTSFSVIEHQPDKPAAIAEVARVLRPGGTFAVSFDICEPEQGMSFPDWNGRALTLQEFEEELWLHPAFGNTVRPTWDQGVVKPFLEWHRTTAPHHNYVAASAVLRRA